MIAAEPVERKFLKALKGQGVLRSWTRRLNLPKPNRRCDHDEERKLLERVRAATLEFISVDDSNPGQCQPPCHSRNQDCAEPSPDQRSQTANVWPSVARVPTAQRLLLRTCRNIQPFALSVAPRREVEVS